MKRVFVSSTYKDLALHRAEVEAVLVRMRNTFIGMEHFGSHGDEPGAVCEEEIANADVFVGIYAWRYGWQPQATERAITELEFDFAQEQGKPCLCYLVDEDHPWPPRFIDLGTPAERLQRFKTKVSKLVRSTFTTPNDLAKQVAADLVRQLTEPIPKETFGGLVRVNWEIFSPKLREVLGTAYSQARVEAADGVVATRHVVTALASIPSTASSLMASFSHVPIQPLRDNRPEPRIEDLFTYEKPISSCVLASMNRLLPEHSRTQRLLAVELAVDLIKKGTGTSVADFRHAGIDAGAVDKTMSHIRRVSRDASLLRDALEGLDDAQVLHMAYLADIDLAEYLTGSELRDELLNTADRQDKLLLLVGELMRRQPSLVAL